VLELLEKAETGKHTLAHTRRQRMRSFFTCGDHGRERKNEYGCTPSARMTLEQHARAHRERPLEDVGGVLSLRRRFAVIAQP
jgi:hypothetical protein